MGLSRKRDSVAIPLVTQEVMMLTSEEVGSRWKSVLRKLGLKDHDIENLEDDAVRFGWRSTERSYQGLKLWVQLCERSPTVKDLVEGLKDYNPSLAGKVKRHVGIEDPNDLVKPENVKKCIHDLNPGPLQCIERKEIIDSLVEFCAPCTSTRLLVLVGLPGMGKSQVIKATNQCLQDLHPDYLVYRPRLTCTENTVEKVFSEVLNCIDPDCHSEKKLDSANLIRKTLRKLDTIKRHFLLMLDVSHTRPSFQFWEDLLNRFSNLLNPENPWMKLLVSASREPYFRQADLPSFKVVKLHELDREKSITFLKSIYPELGDRSAEVIYSYCGGTPLALRSVADYISKEPQEISTIVGDCKSIHFHSSVLNSILGECVSKSYFKILFDQMNKQSQHSLIKLSVIEGAFDDQLAQELLTTREFDALETLARRYLILDKRNSKYRLNRIFKEFLGCYILEENAFFKTVYDNAMVKYIRIFINLLYSLNAIFMNSNLPNTSPYVDCLIDSAGCYMDCICAAEEASTCACIYESIPCRCNKANLAIDIFKKYKLQIRFCLRKAFASCFGEAIAFAGIDCVSTTISFLNKIIPFEKLHQLLMLMVEYAKEKKDKQRLAYLFVSLSFIRMANKVDVDEKAIFKLLSKAKDILEVRRKQLRSDAELEVLAHCYAKLGRLAGSYKKDFKQGKDLIEAAVVIRRNEVKRDSNKVLEAATYVDLANLCRDFKKYDLALQYLQLEVLPVYRQYLWVHPFTASTLRFIGIIYNLKGNFQQAHFYYQHSLQVQLSLMSFKADRVLTLRDMARNFVALKELDSAKLHYEQAIKLECELFRERMRWPDMYKELSEVEASLGNKQEMQQALEKLKDSKAKQKVRKRSHMYERNVSRISVGSSEDFDVTFEEDGPRTGSSMWRRIMVALKWAGFLLLSTVLAIGIQILYALYTDKKQCPAYRYLRDCSSGAFF